MKVEILEAMVGKNECLHSMDKKTDRKLTQTLLMMTTTTMMMQMADADVNDDDDDDDDEDSDSNTFETNYTIAHSFEL